MSVFNIIPRSPLMSDSSCTIQVCSSSFRNKFTHDIEGCWWHSSIIISWWEAIEKDTNADDCRRSNVELYYFTFHCSLWKIYKLYFNVIMANYSVMKIIILCMLFYLFYFIFCVWSELAPASFFLCSQYRTNCIVLYAENLTFYIFIKSFIWRHLNMVTA